MLSLASLTPPCPPPSPLSPTAPRRNPDAWALGNGSSAYISSLPVQADEGLTQSLLSEARAALGESSVVTGLNATADSFYSSQV